MILQILILADDDLCPVQNVGIEAVLIGEYGGDGGFNFNSVKTDDRGLVTISEGPGVYQVYLLPPPGSRFRYTAFMSLETMLSVREDGTYFPKQFRIAVRPTEATHPLESAAVPVSYGNSSPPAQ